MSRPSKGPKIFWAGPNFLSQTKNLYTFCANPKHFVSHLGFCAGKNVFEEALNAINFWTGSKNLDLHKTFGDP